MAGAFRIRSATAGDVAVILDLVRGLAEYERLSHLVSATEDGVREALFGEHPGAEAVLAFEGETAVGFAVYFHNFSTFLGRKGLWLEDLFVKPQHRRRGYGKALLLHVARIAHERGCGRFEWAALDWNASDCVSGVYFYRLEAVSLADHSTTFTEVKKVMLVR